MRYSLKSQDRASFPSYLDFVYYQRLCCYKINVEHKVHAIAIIKASQKPAKKLTH